MSTLKMLTSDTSLANFNATSESNNTVILSTFVDENSQSTVNLRRMKLVPKSSCK